jgi:hypothetical protein
MGAGVARECSRNRCLARWTVWIPPIVAAEAEQVERTRRRTWSRARSEVFVPYRSGRPEETAESFGDKLLREIGERSLPPSQPKNRSIRVGPGRSCLPLFLVTSLVPKLLWGHLLAVEGQDVLAKFAWDERE